MKISKIYRAPSSLTVTDEDASRRLSGSALEDKNARKAADKLETVQLAERIAAAQNLLYAQKQHKLLIVLQGMDTSGKDGTVRGVFGLIDPLGIRAVSFKAPSADELAHDYLWRIHAQMPAVGETVIFNRSHYEDVLITHVHDWIDQAECERRYAQIRDFERMLAETGTVVLKFFLHISKNEQKLRLQERLADPEKHWKFDPQDLVERSHWDAYQVAYAEAINATDADHAPWYCIPADSKTMRNLAIAQIVIEKLDSLKLKVPAPIPSYKNIEVE